MFVSQKELHAVQRLPAEARYNYFIKRVADTEMVWGLYKDGWATTSDNYKRNSIPLWPAREYALVHCTGDWKDCSPRSVSVQEFLSDFSPYAQQSNYAPSVFFVEGVGGIDVDWDKLCNDIGIELEKY